MYLSTRQRSCFVPLPINPLNFITRHKENSGELLFFTSVFTVSYSLVTLCWSWLSTFLLISYFEGIELSSELCHSQRYFHSKVVVPNDEAINLSKRSARKYINEKKIDKIVKNSESSNT